MDDVQDEAVIALVEQHQCEAHDAAHLVRAVIAHDRDLPEGRADLAVELVHLRFLVLQAQIQPADVPGRAGQAVFEALSVRALHKRLIAALQFFDALLLFHVHHQKDDHEDQKHDCEDQKDQFQVYVYAQTREDPVQCSLSHIRTPVNAWVCRGAKRETFSHIFYVM